MEKGELPEGWYYVKGSRVEGIYAYTAEYLNNMYRPGNGERIIEQVPSYEEWKALKASYEMSNDANLKQAMWMADMEKHNAKLEELLKEIRSKIKTVYDMDLREFITSAVFDDSFVTKIDEVLK